MAFATEDFGWGKIEILYNGAPTQNLHIATIALQNASSRDLQQVRVDIASNAGTTVLRAYGQVRGSLEFFPFAADYQHVLGRAERQELSAAEFSYWTVRSPFVIPVLNREQFAEIRLLVSRGDHQTPIINVAIEHVGVKSEHQSPTQLVLGVRVGQALIAGVIAGLLIVFAADSLGLPTWLIALLAWIVGASAQHLGALVIRGCRIMLKMAD